MKLGHRVIEELSREWIISYRCGCSVLTRTKELVCRCLNCPEQLKLPFD